LPLKKFATEPYKVTESDAKIMKRIVVLDSSYVDTLLGFPL